MPKPTEDHLPAVTGSLPLIEGIKFREIPGCPGYAAGSNGTIWSCWKAHGLGYGIGGTQVMSSVWKQLGTRDKGRKLDGRKRCKLRTEDGTYRRAYVSTFILEAFVGPRPEGLECCHNDGNCRNDSIDNLRWDTVVSNKADMVRHGTRLKGEQINTAKLTEQDVVFIRKSSLSLRTLAAKFGVCKLNIRFIKEGKTWKHVSNAN